MSGILPRFFYALRISFQDGDQLDVFSNVLERLKSVIGGLMATLTTANEEAANKKLVPAIDVFSSTDDESLLDFKLLQEGKHYHLVVSIRRHTRRR